MTTVPNTHPRFVEMTELSAAIRRTTMLLNLDIDEEGYSAVMLLAQLGLPIPILDTEESEWDEPAALYLLVEDFINSFEPEVINRAQQLKLQFAKIITVDLDEKVKKPEQTNDLFPGDLW